MKKSTKILSLLLAAVMSAVLFTGCGGAPDSKLPEPDSKLPEPTAELPEPTAELPDIKGEVFDVGQFTIIVPEGWYAMKQVDIFSDTNEIMDYKVKLLKGASSDEDEYECAEFTITYFNGTDNEFISTESYYTDITEIDSKELANYGSAFKWTGYEGTMVGERFQILEGKNGNQYVEISITAEMNGETLNYQDETIQGIVRSIKIK